MYECKNPYGKCIECSLKEKYTNYECPFKSEKECKNCPNYYHINSKTNECEMCESSKNNCNNIDLKDIYLSLSDCESNVDKYKCINNICTLCVDNKEQDCIYNTLNDCKNKCKEQEKQNNTIFIILLIIFLIFVMIILIYIIKKYIMN